MPKPVPSPADYDQPLLRMVEECAVALLETYGAGPVSLAPSDAGENRDASVVGFAGPGFRGSLLLCVSSETLIRTNPAPNTTRAQWVAELGNQLMGRLKLRLCPLGLEMRVSTPMAIEGRGLTLGAGAPARGPICLDVSGGQVVAWLSYELGPGVILDFESAPPPEITEGQALVF